MVDVDNYLSKNILKPRCALIVYGHQYRWNNYLKNCFLEIRQIGPDGMMQEGKPVSEGFLKKLSGLSKGLTPEHQIPYGAIPKTLLFADTANGKYIWYDPPGKRTLRFVNRELDGEYNMPCTVFMVRDNLLYAYVVAANTPKDDSPLLHGPFYNIYEDCHMCLGNAKHTMKASPTFDDVIEHWEILFWNSLNNHPIFWDSVLTKEEIRKKVKKPSLEETVLLCREGNLDCKRLLPTGNRLKDLYTL